MALRLEDRAMATSFLTVAIDHSHGAIWLCKDRRTPNYLSLGLFHGYRFGDYGSLHLFKFPTCGAMTNTRQTNHLSDGFIATSLATMVPSSFRCVSLRCDGKRTPNYPAFGLRYGYELGY
jgi:hypothetical protein